MMSLKATFVVMALSLLGKGVLVQCQPDTDVPAPSPEEVTAFPTEAVFNNEEEGAAKASWFENNVDDPNPANETTPETLPNTDTEPPAMTTATLLPGILPVELPEINKTSTTNEIPAAPEDTETEGPQDDTQATGNNSSSTVDEGQDNELSGENHGQDEGDDAVDGDDRAAGDDADAGDDDAVGDDMAAGDDADAGDDIEGGDNEEGDDEYGEGGDDEYGANDEYSQEEEGEHIGGFYLCFFEFGWFSSLSFLFAEQLIQLSCIFRRVYRGGRMARRRI